MGHRIRIGSLISALAIVVATAPMIGPTHIHSRPLGGRGGSGSSLIAVSFPDATHGWAVGRVAASQTPLIFATSNGGAQWNAQTPPAGVSLVDAVSFADDLHGWAAGYSYSATATSAVIIATADGGTSWSPQNTPSLNGGGVNGIKFATSNDGWAVGGSSGGGFIIHTGNGGASWNAQTVPADVGTVVSVSFVDATHGWASGIGVSGVTQNPGLVLATSNGGASWTEVPLPSGLQPQAIAFIDLNNGWVVGSDSAGSGQPPSSIAVTHDGGVSWARQSVPAGTGALSGVAFASATVGWAVGNLFDGRAAILGTTDGGSTWQQQQPPATTASLAAVAAANATKVWAVGSGACMRPSIAATTTGGASWTDQTAGPPWVAHLADVASAGTTTAWAVGSDSCDQGVILGTRDAGTSWAAETVPPGVGGVSGVSFPDAQHGWAVARIIGAAIGSAIIATSDGGTTWVRQTEPMGVGQLWGIKFVNSSVGWAVGTGYVSYSSSGQLLKTTNGGATWSLQTLPVTTLTGLWFTDSLNGWVTGTGSSYAGVVMATSDGGTNWTTQTIPAGSSPAALRFSDSSNGWTAGSNFSMAGPPSGQILHTVDGGANWSSQPLPAVASELTGVSFPSTSAGWTVGFSRQSSGASAGVVLGTASGGTTWTQEVIPTGVSAVNGVAFAGTTTGWAAGDAAVTGGQQAGVILGTSNGGTTWTAQPYAYPPANLQSPVAALPALANSAYGGYTTSAYIQNTGSAPAHVRLRYFDSSGNPAGTGDSATIAPNATWTVRQDNGHSFATGGAGSGVIWSDQPVVAFVNEFAPGTGDATSYSAVAIGNWTGGTLFAPAIANAAYGGYTTGIALINAGPVATNVTVVYRDTSGATVNTQTQPNVPPNAYRALYSGDPALGLPAGFAGTATITSSTGTVAAIVNETGPGGQFSSYDALPTPSTTLFAPAALNNAFGGYYTGMGVQNASGSAGSVAVDYYDNAGVATTKNFSIAANGYLGIYQGSLTDGPPPGAYTARITGSVPLVAIVNEIAPSPGAAKQSTSYPAFDAGAATLNLPLVTNASADGWSTGEGIMNVGASPATVNVSYFDAATGNPIGSPQSQTLQPKAFWGLYQPAGGLPAGVRASATVSIGFATSPGEGIAVICNESSPTSFMSYVGG